MKMTDFVSSWKGAGRHVVPVIGGLAVALWGIGKGCNILTDKITELQSAVDVGEESRQILHDLGLTHESDSVDSTDPEAMCTTVLTIMDTVMKFGEETATLDYVNHGVVIDVAKKHGYKLSFSEIENDGTTITMSYGISRVYITRGAEFGRSYTLMKYKALNGDDTYRFFRI